MKVITCQVASLTPLTEHVYKALLKPNMPVDFSAGQYLNFVMSDEDKRPFSIASAPGAELIELQIGAFGSDSYPMQVIEHIKANTEVTVEMPFGNAQLRESSERPLLLIAGGTGFSYVKSMFEHLALKNSQREVIVYWGLRDTSACYELEQTAAMINKLANGKFIPVIEAPSADWKGRSGMVHKAVMDDVNNLVDYDIYLAGRFEMVAVVRGDFVEQGALIEHMYADAFAFI
jgi:aquacobalamin reductase/NAD(P)H-flavin reductase|tara:strand:+ start:1649 stop:2344 length:696 start_codon:yes stop_codon:yes gene_type:complete